MMIINNKGITYLEILLATALLGLVFAILPQIGDRIGSSNKRVSDSVQAYQLHNKIQQIFTKDEICTNTFAGRFPGEKLNAIVNTHNESLILLDHNISLKEIEIPLTMRNYNKNNYEDNFIQIGLKRALIDIDFHLKENSNSKTLKQIPKKLTLRFQATFKKELINFPQDFEILTCKLLTSNGTVQTGQWQLNSNDDVFYDQGNVGIGTNNPQKSFEITDPISNKNSIAVSTDQLQFNHFDSAKTVGQGNRMIAKRFGEFDSTTSTFQATPDNAILLKLHGQGVDEMNNIKDGGSLIFELEGKPSSLGQRTNINFSVNNGNFVETKFQLASNGKAKMGSDIKNYSKTSMADLEIDGAIQLSNSKLCVAGAIRYNPDKLDSNGNKISFSLRKPRMEFCDTSSNPTVWKSIPTPDSGGLGNTCVERPWLRVSQNYKEYKQPLPFKSTWSQWHVGQGNVRNNPYFGTSNGPYREARCPIDYAVVGINRKLTKPSNANGTARQITYYSVCCPLN